MNRITVLEMAVEYIENNIYSRLNYDDIASHAFCSSYHFQRMFAAVFGLTLGEYIRARKMTLAAAELKNEDSRIIDIALKYGYESQEGFARAFTKFHGITPSQARRKGAKLKSFSRITNYEMSEGGNLLDYTVEECEEMCFAAYKHRFFGVPYGELRFEQEQKFLKSTLNEQWILKGMSATSGENYNERITYCIIDNVDDEGYDFYCAQPFAEKTRRQLEPPLQTVVFPKATYVVFKTKYQGEAGIAYVNMCRRIYCEWLLSTNYRLASSAELIVYHTNNEDLEDGYIEIYISVKAK